MKKNISTGTLLLVGLRTFLSMMVGIWIASSLSSGISYDTASTLMGVSLLLTLFNMVLKPLFILFALPFVVITLGLGIWIINGFLFWLAGSIVPALSVESFWSALFGSLIISIVSFLLSLFIRSDWPPSLRRDNDNGGKSTYRFQTRQWRKDKRHTSKDDDDVIDV